MILSEKAVLAHVAISAWSARKFDKSVTREIHEAHNASDDTGRYNKRLLPADALKEINQISSQARDYHITHSQPWLDEGARVLPSALYMEYAEKMRVYRQQFEAAVEKFIDVYPTYVEQAKKTMNGLYNEMDYPDVRQLRRKFDFDVRILPVPEKSDFRVDIGSDEVKSIQEDVERRLNSVLENTLHDSAERIVEVVGHMAERLKAFKPAAFKGDKTESPFRDTLVSNVADLVELLPAFNLTGDAKMNDIIERIRTDLCSTDPDTLRSDDNARKVVAAKATEILEAVSDFLA